MKITLEIENKVILETALEMAIASNRRAINTSKRPEFTVVYEKEIADLLKAKNSIEVVTETTRAGK